MADRNLPLGSSVELFYKVPNKSIATATVYGLEAKYLGTSMAVPNEDLFFAQDDDPYAPVVAGQISIDAYRSYFTICVRLNASGLVDRDRVEVKLTPQNNLNFFSEPFTTLSAVLGDYTQTSLLIMPPSLVVEEGSVGVLEIAIAPALLRKTTYRVELKNLTSQNNQLNGAQASSDQGLTWTLSADTVEITLPVGSTSFLVKYALLSNEVRQPNRYFDVVVSEKSPVKGPALLGEGSTRITVLDTSLLQYGELISTLCSGETLVGNYANGNGGSYQEPLQMASDVCGAPARYNGERIDSFCAGPASVVYASNGIGGIVRYVESYGASECGWTGGGSPNPDPEVTPTFLSPIRKGATCLLNVEGNFFAGLSKDNSISEYGTRFGKWYFEVEVFLPTSNQKAPGMGFGSHKVNLTAPLGQSEHAWFWWPSDKSLHHAGVVTNYGSTDVVHGDVIGVQVDLVEKKFGFSINGAFQGWAHTGLSTEKMHFLISGRVDSWALVNFGASAFKHPVPVGYYAGFGEVQNPPPERGSLVRYFCIGTSKWAERTDGFGGTYLGLHTEESLECGWIETRPPLGSVIGFVCDGYLKYNKIANGKDGFTLKLSQIDSLDCGFVPTTGALANVAINEDPSCFDDNTVLTGNKLGFSNLHKSVSLDWGNYSGVWYWEIKNWSGEFYAGFQNRTTLGLTDSVWDNHSIGFNPKNGLVNKKGLKERLVTPVAPGTPIGFKIDFVLQEITLYAGLETLVLFQGLNFPTNEIENFYPSVTARRDGQAQGVFNLNPLDFSYSQTPDVLAYQKPLEPYPKRGTLLSYGCDHWTRLANYANGNGGSYTLVYETNSVTCGWYPDPLVGTLLGFYCVGYSRYKTVATGNYLFDTILISHNNVLCGYIPAGTVVSVYCIGIDQWGLISDGADGFYDGLVRTNSYDCGYVDLNDDTSEQTPNALFNLKHNKTLPFTGFDIVHDVLKR